MNVEERGWTLFVQVRKSTLDDIPFHNDSEESVHAAEYCLSLIVGKKFVPTYENTYFIWSENRNDVIQHISLYFLASWTKIRKNKTK